MRLSPPRALTSLRPLCAPRANGVRCSKAGRAGGMGLARNIINEIMTPALARMGLESRRALRRAVENFQNLPEGAAVQLPGKPIQDLPEDAASAVYEMMPTGEFVLAGQGASA